MLPYPALFRSALTAACLWFGSTLNAAPVGYSVREWHEKDGLPADELTGLALAHDGFLWLATNGMLARFDGTVFESMPLPPDVVPQALIPARAANGSNPKTFFLGPISGDSSDIGLWAHDGRSAALQNEPALTGRRPRTLFQAPDGNVWIGCDDGALLRRSGDGTTVVAPPPANSGRKIPGFATDAAGRLWVARGNQLARIEGDRYVDVPWPRNEPELRIASSRHGGLWVFTRTSLYQLNETSDAFDERLRLPELLGAHHLMTALEDRHGDLWVGTRSQGLHRIAGEQITRVPTSSDDIVALCEDAEGSLWVATDGGGLNRLRAQAHQFYDRERGLLDNFSYTVAADNAGAIWLANRDGGVARIVGDTVDPISKRAGWRAFSAKSVYPDPNGSVWITNGLGVFRTVPEQPERISRIAPLSQYRNIRASFVASDGAYWLALDPDRIGRYRDDKLVTFGPEQGFSGREVRAFAEDAQHRLWIGGATGALFRATDTGFVRVDIADAAEAGALQVIRFESDGSLLIGTTRCGVLFVDAEGRGRRRLDRDHGLPNNNVSQILIDNHDHYWFATRGGIFWARGEHVRAFARGEVDDVHTVMLGLDDGVPPLSCLGLYQPAAWKAADGTLWFATRRGILRTDPSSVAAGRDSAAPARLATLSIDDHTVDATPVIEMESSVRKTRMTISVLDLASPGSVLIRCRLDGFDTAWVVLGEDRTLTYPRLPPGTYRLDAMISQGHGGWRPQSSLVIFIVKPQWWQTSWARVAAVLAAGAGLIALTRTIAHRRLRHRLRLAESARLVEQERARIARDIHDDIGATLTRISLLTQSEQQQRPEPSSALEAIYDATRAVTRALDQIVWAINPQHDNVDGFVYYLGNFAQSLLSAAGIRCRLETTDVALDLPLPSQLRHHLFLGCKEALHNAVKHSGATEVTIRIQGRPGALAVTIADDGHGLPADGAVRADPLRTLSGHGLRNLHQHMADIHGRCTISPGPGHGTTIEFLVPLASHPTP